MGQTASSTTSVVNNKEEKGVADTKKNLKNEEVPKNVSGVIKKITPISNTSISSSSGSDNKSNNKNNDTPDGKRKIDEVDDEYKNELYASAGQSFRGIAAASRAKLPALKAAASKVVRSVGTNRPLAFASEGAVAGKSMIKPWMYYGAWGLSGLAITGDITCRMWDAPPSKKYETVAYWSAFHIPASFVVPAYIIHQVVHYTEGMVNNNKDRPNKIIQRIPIRFRSFIPVSAALCAIIPVVPTVDYLFEQIMEPTLGAYLGLEFHHHAEDEK
mmetsp:Transcript_40933/g.46504  ORF Transcript_40933/g.46504 Transcript_40933/m.46504 type:complete len:272 (-) Transcript_40933:253-1068(-)